MKYDAFMEAVREFPVIESTALVALGMEPKSMAVQLSRWVKAGKLLRLRRGFYLLPDRLRHKEPPVEYLANLLVEPSYVSLEYALSFHGLIPEAVHMVQSVTTGRGIRISTPVGEFSYRHTKPDWFFGYREFDVGTSSALVATVEKALLDLVYLSPGEFTPERIEGLRLQNHEEVDFERLRAMAERDGSPRLIRAAAEIRKYIAGDTEVP